MGRFARNLLIFFPLALLLSCGEQSLFLGMGSETTDLQIQSVSDGQVLASSKDLQLTISTQSTEKHQDLEMEITLTSTGGASVFHQRQAVPELNKALALSLPDLATGQYRLDIVLYSAGEVVQKKSSSFFVAQNGWRVAGIKSFPPVITGAANVLLKAELEIPDGADPYLRWSWKGKVISRGQLSKGLGQILWVTPTDEGVYTVTLEMFPSAPPEGSDFPFSSSLSLSTDIYVSNKGAAGKGDLGPKASYLSLLRLQASLADNGAGATKGRQSAKAIGSPQIVSAGSSFGYHLDGDSGFELPWFALPVDGGSLQPFTVSMGISLEDFQGNGTLVNAVQSGGDLSVRIDVDGTTRTPSARIATGSGATIDVPWTSPGLEKNQRYLLSLSITPKESSLGAQWFLDGVQVSAWTGAYTPVPATTEGTTTIGGGGIVGVVDEFAVYYRDPEGRPATDPDLYRRAEESLLGSAYVLADGFDGLYLPKDFEAAGDAKVGGGSLTLAAGGSVELPSIPLSGAPLDFLVGLDPDSSPAVALQLFWKGEPDPIAEAAVAVTGSQLRLRVSADGSTVVVYPGPDQTTLSIPGGTHASPGLVVKLANPQDAKAPLVIEQILVNAAPTG